MIFAQRVNDFCRVLVAFLLLNLALIYTMAPFNLFILFTDALGSLPLPAIAAIGIIAWSLSAPALAAAFAAYRDAPTMRHGEYDNQRRKYVKLISSIDAIANPYWRPDEDTRMLRPFTRTYCKQAKRTFTISLIYAMPMCLSFAGTAYLLCISTSAASICLAVTAYLLLSQLAALNLVVEFPHAHYPAMLRVSLVSTVRKLPFALLAFAVLAIYLASLLNWPWMILFFGTGLLFFFAYHAIDHVTKPMVDQMIKKETDGRTDLDDDDDETQDIADQTRPGLPRPVNP